MILNKQSIILHESFLKMLWQVLWDLCKFIWLVTLTKLFIFSRSKLKIIVEFKNAHQVLVSAMFDEGKYIEFFITWMFTNNRLRQRTIKRWVSMYTSSDASVSIDKTSSLRNNEFSYSPYCLRHSYCWQDLFTTWNKEYIALNV